MRPTILLVLTALACLAPPMSAQRHETGFLDRTVVQGALTYRYQVYVPADYVATRAWPVILFLHGAGERGADGLLQTTVGLAPAVRRDPTRFPAIIVFPQLPADSQWVGAPAEAAMLALRRSMEEFRVDPARVYLTGLSMGGHGTWYLAYRHADLFAAVAPICGWVPELPGHFGTVPVVPVDSGSPLPSLARRLRRLPIWIFHGEMDQVIPVTASREAAAALKAAGSNVRYTEFLGVDHDSWDAAYASREFTDWLFAQRLGGR
ncbi:MAG TPA: PHB depolymerase family esterase [Gemmatimonadales bacterium]|nr:PHB depolymerase family esterase [Gemmatimonadales bacterium]